MRRALAWLAVIALTALAAGCPRGGGTAEPARVELEWPDAGVLVLPADAAPPAADASE